ncbi:unnamed protein product [Clonostachys byssicola]|uniref:N-glycosylation protein EOS1 n=1 Tax=Clonostachys byssicola TaxID=160290 RepID=A0A9N9UG26_9HYPO|nr:unnamed protein product [Clonostachys byssicola]
MSLRGHNRSNTSNPPHAHQRASSVPSSRSPCPPLPVVASLTPAALAAAEPKIPSSPSSDDPNAHDDEKSRSATANSASLLQPRVAVALNVPQPWHPWLFTLRLASILPAVFWGTPVALRLLLLALELVLGPPNIRTSEGSGGGIAHHLASYGGGGDGAEGGGEVLLVPVTEMALASIWCFACGYLSFFFTDCLMSRWLINYTPQATMVRLLTIAAVNAYVTMTVLSLAGGFQDLRLLLPGWIGIATTLTVCYHITHQKINIRKETSTSINVFSIASYITMVTLLLHMHLYKPDYPPMPIVTWGRAAWQRVQDSDLLSKLAGSGASRSSSEL